MMHMWRPLQSYAWCTRMRVMLPPHVMFVFMFMFMLMLMHMLRLAMTLPIARELASSGIR